MDQDAEQILAKVLKEHGYSVTNPRRIVFELLKDKEPQTIQQLIASSSSKIDRATLYRVIAVFEKLGLVHRITVGWKYKLELSELFVNHHHHFSCTNCKITVGLNSDSLEKHLTELEAEHNFKLTKHTIELAGLCQDCQSI